MKALIVSLESFQKGEIPEEVRKYILANNGNIFTILDESSKIKTKNARVAHIAIRVRNKSFNSYSVKIYFFIKQKLNLKKY